MVNFTISIPTDEGFIGRKCNNLDCQRYFRVYADSLKHEMFCPYCGVRYPSNELWTDDQYKYVRTVAEEKSREVIHNEFDKMFRRLARKSSRNKHFRMTYRPKPYRPKLISPQYHELQVDSELTCPECNFRFQVHGIGVQLVLSE